MCLKKSILVLTIILLTSCASVMDPNRGMFVSSKVQNVKLENFTDQSKVYVAPFVYNSEPNSETSTSTAMVGSTFIPVTHHLQFDSVDRDYLHQSITVSLENAGMTLVENPSQADKVVNVAFDKIGMFRMGSGLSVGIYPYFEAVVEVKKGDNVLASDQVTAKGSALSMSVANSKNGAIKQFVSGVAALIQAEE